jgi:predicted secreted protein
MKTLALIIVLATLPVGAPLPLAKDPAPPPGKKDEKVLRLTDADNKKTVKVAVGKSFDIALKGNPTTGYQWQVAKIEGDGILQKGKSEYLVDKHPDRMVGVGGTFVFHFNVTRAVKTTVQLVYVRPWEKDVAPEKTFELTVSPAAIALTDGTLLFEGTVKSINTSPLPDSDQSFVITMKVNRVIKGRFRGTTFQFRVHSPARSGLKLNERYIVEAKQSNGKYVVDPNQWTRPSSAPLGGSNRH